MKPIIDTRGNQLGWVDDQKRIFDRNSHPIGYEGDNGQIVVHNHVVGSTNERDNIPFMFRGTQQKKK